MCLVLFTLWTNASIDSAQTYLCRAQKAEVQLEKQRRGSINSFFNRVLIDTQYNTGKEHCCMHGLWMLDKEQ